ncbi:Nuclear speckle splicing regulatory protein 1 [Coemansia sp. RSA 1085]|nr:Nuclear speckle splicing regulatory protein 1 [Coemansia sp. RSA 1085]
MRKSTLKFGLNARKPVSNSKPQGTTSVFSTDAPPSPPIPQPTSTSRLTEPAETDPSIYAYDEVYDKIDNARRQLKSSQSTDLKPRYMEKLLETAQQRKLQSEAAKERLLEKERKLEGDKFADKETFITESYKEHKEQRQRLLEQEDEKEKLEAQKEPQQFGASVGFYKQLLKQIDREDLSKVAEADGPLDTNTDAAADKRESKVELESGLNVIGSKAYHRTRHQSPTGYSPKDPKTNIQQPVQQGAYSSWNRRSIEQEKHQLERARTTTAYSKIL